MTDSDPSDLAELAGVARAILERIRFVVLATVDPDGTTRASPVYYNVAGSDLYWVSSPESHHSANVARQPRVGAVVYDSTVEPGPATGAVYVTGSAREVPAEELEERCAVAFGHTVGTARAFAPDELSGDAGLRLYVLRVETWEVHVRGSHPTLGTGIDRRVEVTLG